VRATRWALACSTAAAVALILAPLASAQEHDALFSKAASKVAERRVPVYCWYDRFEWNSIFGADAAASYSLIYDEINLSPSVCNPLDRAVYLGWRPTGFAGKSKVAFALETLAHEAEHAYGIRGEKKADCYAMQDMELAATHLGLGWRYGRALAKFYWRYIYPYSSYWSAACYDGGPWDIYDEAVWP
jgi:nitroreductase